MSSNVILLRPGRANSEDQLALFPGASAPDQPTARRARFNSPEASPTPSAQMWLQNPVDAFRKSERAGRLASHSVEQYGTMLGAYVRWLAERNLDIASAQASDVEVFLETLTARRKGQAPTAPAPSTVRRYLQVIYGAHEQAVLAGLRNSNPAEPIMNAAVRRRTEGGEVRPAPRILDSETADLFIEWSLRQPTLSWVDARDKAIRLLFLGTGVTVSELQRISPAHLLQQVDGGVRLHVQALGYRRAREIPIKSFAIPAVLEWAAQLVKMLPGCDVLFPTRVYTPPTVDRADPGRYIASDEAFRVVQEALNQIGFTMSRQGPQTLRNTFIAMCVKDGIPGSVIQSWCGLETSESVDRIAREAGPGE